MTRPSLSHPAYEQAGLLAQPGFEVQIFSERVVHEAYALRIGASVQQDAVPDDPMSQQRGGVVEDHEIDQIAADGPGHQWNEPEAGILERPRSGGAGVVDENRDVDVALRTRRAPDPAPEQPGQADRRLGAQAARKVVAQAADRGVAHSFERRHPGANVPDTDSAKNAWRTRAGWSTITG